MNKLAPTYLCELIKPYEDSGGSNGGGSQAHLGEKYTHWLLGKDASSLFLAVDYALDTSIFADTEMKNFDLPS